MPSRILTHIPPRKKNYVTVTNVDHFKDTLPKLQPGDRIVYHKGYLFHDRAHSKGAALRERISRLARAVWKAYKDGSVTLVQRRIGPHVCEYQAVKL